MREESTPLCRFYLALCMSRAGIDALADRHDAGGFHDDRTLV